jgi:membrane-associated PAP2 superfamily phosphatase
MRCHVLKTPLKPARLEWWLLTAAALYLIFWWDHLRIDAGVMQWIGTPQGFPLRHNVWLEAIGHDGARNLALLVLLLLWLAVIRAPRWLSDFSRRERLFMALATSLCALLIGFLKQHSVVSCPWDQAAFGGSAYWVPHWAWWVTTDGGPGGCFPGGHASSGFAFIAAAWPGLASRAGSRRWRWGARVLLLALASGLALGVVQTLRGAHPPGHTLWTAWLCWTASGLLYAAFEKAMAAAGARPAPPRGSSAIGGGHG